MTGIRRLSKSIRKLDKVKEDTAQEFSGILGVSFKGTQYVEVPNREGYVYVRLRSNLNEVVQAYNGTVSPVYDLPVLIKRDKTFERYLISGRDLGRYGNWGTSSYLPRHGAQHSFPNDNYGGDIVWIYDRQFVPLSIAPSGAYGANNVYINGDILYWEGDWIFSGDTGTADLFAYKPTGTTAKLVLVYIDSNGNPALLEGDDIFDASITGMSQIIPYLPALSTTLGIPLGAVRLVSGTSRITWNEIYDLRPLLNQANWSAPYQVEDEGTPLARRAYLNFKGANIWAVDNPGDDSTDVSVSGSPVGGHIIEDAGVPMTDRTYLDFKGPYVWVDDSAGADATIVSASGTPRHIVLHSGSAVYPDQEYLDFRGNSVLSVTDDDLGATYNATEISISGTHVIQSATNPTGTMRVFPGMLWLQTA